MRVKPSAPLVYMAVIALLAGGGLLYSVTKSKPARAGSLEVSPAALTLAGSSPSTLTVRNVGVTSITVDISPPPFMVVDPLSAVVLPGRALEVEASALPSFRIGEGDLKITAGADEIKVPVTLNGALNAATGGSAIEIADPKVSFPRGVWALSRTVSNASNQPAEWKASPPHFLKMTPDEGTLDPGASIVMRIEVDRSDLRIGDTKATVQVYSPSGSGMLDITVTTGPDPVISLVEPLLDFGIGGRTDAKTKRFKIRNAGNAELRYQASVDRAFLRLGAGSSGALDPGEEAEVALTFDYSQTKVSFDWVAEVPISSNGGSAVLAVEGTSDWSAPALIRGTNQMDFMHEHCSGGKCEKYRHLRGTFEDQSKIILVEAEYRVCTGSGASPTCDEFRKAPPSKLVSGNDRRGTYEIEIGPVPKTCVPGVGVIVHYRFKLADGLRNSSLRPGSATFYGYLHCSRAD